MKKIIKYFTILFMLIFLPITVKANSINSIDMDIYVDASGTAHVTERWNASLNEGTEGYKPYYNIGNAKITNFSVSENGKIYTNLTNWNTNGTFNDKAYKNGINPVNDGVELCWGISEYGSHVYTLSYNIVGFVSAATDADMIYWTLIPYDLSSKPNKVHIKISADEAFSDNLNVWGYGNYGGTAYVYDGYIEMNSEGTLKSDEYMTILVQFDKGSFNTANVLDNNFEYYHNMADQGATEYKKNGSTFGSVLGILINVFIWGIVIWAIVVGAKNSANKIGTRNLDFGKDGKILPKDIPNYRDIPFKNDIYRAYWVAIGYNLISKKTDFLGAIILKWLKEQKIKINKVQEGKIIKKDAANIDLTIPFTSDNLLEEELHKMMFEASRDGILESKEFEKWCDKNYSKILEWFDKAIDSETDKLVSEGKIVIGEKKTFGAFTTKTYTVDPAMKEEAVKLKGLKNFLEEFSRINEKEAIEVNMWEYYLVYAQILGIADKVAKQFKKLYPEIIENYGYDFDDFIFINMICYSGMHSASLGQQRAQNYNAGGGGFSAGGGGGGSFGGGGGGGFR